MSSDEISTRIRHHIGAVEIRRHNWRVMLDGKELLVLQFPEPVTEEYAMEVFEEGKALYLKKLQEQS